MRKMIKVAPEHEKKVWSLIFKSEWRVVDLGHNFFEVNQAVFAELRASGISFEVVEPEEWIWKNGYPFQRIAESSRS